MIDESTLSTEDKLRLKQLELSALLDVTGAINGNAPEEDLYRIYEFTMRAAAGAKKLALYVKEQDVWIQKVSYGVSEYKYPDFEEYLEKFLLADILEITDLQKFSIPAHLTEFEKVIPIAHKKQILAYVFLGGLSTDPEIEQDQISFIQTFSNIVLVAIENKRFSRKQIKQERMRGELEVARRVQSMLFPKYLPNDKHIKVCADYLPHSDVGGDYYDFIPIDEHRFLLCIADVSGKGIPAALLMSNFQASLRTLLRQTTDPDQIVRELNLLVNQVSEGEYFVTAFIGLFDLKERSMVYINAGHHCPILIDDVGHVMLPEEGTIILGIFNELPFVKPGKIEFSSDELFFLAYTDGLVEVRNEQEEEFGSERLKNFLLAHHREEPSLIHEKLIAEIDHFRGGMPLIDDIALLSCKINFQESDTR